MCQVTQTIEADAVATGVQDSTIDQSDTIEGTAPVSGDASGDAMLSAATATGETGDAVGTMAADATGEAARGLSEPVDGSLVVDADRQHHRHARQCDGQRRRRLTARSSAPSTRPPGSSSTPPATSSAASPACVDGATVAGTAGGVLGVLDAATTATSWTPGNVVGPRLLAR